MLAGDDLCRRADFKARGDAVLHAGVTGLADCRNAAVPDADVRLQDAPVIEHDDIGDDEIRRPFRARHLRLSLAVAHDLAAAERHFIAIAREVPLDLQHEPGIGKAHAIAGGGAIEARVVIAGDFHGASRNLRVRTSRMACSRRASSGPLTSPLMPNTIRFPANGTRATSRPSPGSNRNDVPAGISSRCPYAAAR